MAREMYARLLDVAVKIGLGITLLVAALYFSGALPSTMPPERVHEYWGMGLEELHDALGDIHGRWGWIGRLGTGDGISYLPIAYLGMVTIAGYVRMVPILLRRRDFIRLTVVLLQTGFLCLVASGVIT